MSLAVLASLSLGACTVLEEDKIDYKTAKKGNSLEVPPDLVQLSKDNRYFVPGSAPTASAFQAGAGATPVIPTAAAALGDVQIERAGSQRWLVVNRTPDKVFPLLRDFWTTNGFLLTTDDQNTGIMETDWAENRAKLPQDFIRATIGKLFDSIYSTGERDKFRSRVEANAKGGTEIYISHRGLVEQFSPDKSGATVWIPRASDPELEAEFLRRLMVRLGINQEQSKVLIAAAPTKPNSKVATVDGQPVVQLDEGFDRAWRRVGLALDRTGFTVEDRDRSQGVYFVRYVPVVADKKEPGFFAKLFSSEAAIPVMKYRIIVKSTANESIVSVRNAAGTAPAALADAQNIVKLLAEDLK
ncbi:MAG TPA: outer membrane protein assembly factor BamC [Burkholderiaceae bacterium]|nr:outer membrane protein assembly factor BamC [Burkholderiaceae bacterium]